MPVGVTQTQRVVQTSSIDGVERLIAVRKLDRYPLYIAAGIDRQRIVAGWYHDVGRLALFAFPTAFGLMPLGGGDIGLHLALGLVLAAVGFTAKASARSAP